MNTQSQAAARAFRAASMSAALPAALLVVCPLGWHMADCNEFQVFVYNE